MRAAVDMGTSTCFFVQLTVHRQCPVPRTESMEREAVAIDTDALHETIYGYSLTRVASRGCLRVTESWVLFFSRPESRIEKLIVRYPALLGYTINTVRSSWWRTHPGMLNNN